MSFPIGPFNFSPFVDNIINSNKSPASKKNGDNYPNSKVSHHLEKKKN